MKVYHKLWVVKKLTFPYASASAWAKKLHMSSSWLLTISPGITGDAQPHHKQLVGTVTKSRFVRLWHHWDVNRSDSTGWKRSWVQPFKYTDCWLLIIPMKSQGTTRPYMSSKPNNTNEHKIETHPSWRESWEAQTGRFDYYKEHRSCLK
jgi:hypothetical protein